VPVPEMRTTSVKVPPMSTPMRWSEASLIARDNKSQLPDGCQTARARPSEGECPPGVVDEDPVQRLVADTRLAQARDDAAQAVVVAVAAGAMEVDLGAHVLRHEQLLLVSALDQLDQQLDALRVLRVALALAHVRGEVLAAEVVVLHEHAAVGDAQVVVE